MHRPAHPRPFIVLRSASADQDGKVRNISTGLRGMKPLYISCSNHHHHHHHRQRLRNKSFVSILKSTSEMPSPEPICHADSTSSPFMRLPTEIRLQIYSLLLLPRSPSDLLPTFEKICSSAQDYFDYDKTQLASQRPLTARLPNPTLRIRTIDPGRYEQRMSSMGQHTRSVYAVRADRFNSRCMNTTYHCVNMPFSGHNTSILRVNRQMHTEAAEMLYGSYIFDFDTHIEAIIPFLSDLTPFARSCIKGVRIVKRALPYVKEFDKCEWHNALNYLTSVGSNISLRRLELGVVAGRPGETGWDGVSRYSPDDFRAMLLYSDGMEWLQCLLDIKELEELDVEAIVEHCPPSTASSAMEKFVKFSASVDTSFAQFLEGKLLQRVAA